MDTKLEIPQKEMSSNIKNLKIVLNVKTRKFHWNVAGERFIKMHNLFEAQYNELELIIDEVAERIGKLGDKAIGTMEELSDHSILKECTKYKDKFKKRLQNYNQLPKKKISCLHFIGNFE
jgi:starvation-inducible DNA-binding protein